MDGRFTRKQPLTALVTGATAAMIALTACALFVVDSSSSGTNATRLWPMILAASCATLLVMSLLHADLQKVYGLIAERERLAHRDARTDPLTGLANRKSLLEALEVESRSDRNLGKLLLLVDLDRFKLVNDTRGHDIGDELLVAIGRRLEEAKPEAMIARLGGDEFAILANVSDIADAEHLCAKTLSIFSTPFALSRGECLSRGSVGATFLDHGLTPSELLRRADIAMYAAKSEKRGFRIFDRQMVDAATRRGRLSIDLLASVGSFDGFYAVFQPIVSRDGALAGIEALLRWRHPTFGMVPPLEIVSVAEDVQCINELGIFMAKQACEAARTAADVIVALNVSPVQLLDSRFREQLMELVASSNIDAEQLQIEIRETDFVARGSEMADVVSMLQTSGFKIAVDDFGSSTSSLVQLRRFGVSVLKLDPKVLRNAREVDNTAVIRAKVELARALGMVVVCEGVGNEADRHAALNSNCDLLQGYLFGRPVALDALPTWRLKAA